MALKQVVWVCGALVIGGVGACNGDGDAPPATDAAEAGAGGEPEVGGEAGRGGSASEGGAGAGQAGHGGEDCAATLAPGGGPGELLPGCSTLKVPEQPFLIEAIQDPGDNVCQDVDDCRVGPWLMIFESLPDGQLQGSLISANRSQWGTEHDLEAAQFQLREEHGEFRLVPGTEATLATYTYGHYEDRVPGVCLVAPGLVGTGSDIGSRFRFFDDDGDGVADGVALGGSVKGLGQRGGDYDYDCGDESFPFATRGRVVDTTVQLSGEGDVLRPRLIARDGFLKGGSAWVRGPEDFVKARPLTLFGYTYGYVADVVLQPGAPLEWRFDVIDSFDRKLEGGLSFGEAEFWAKVRDGSFESYEDGEAWGTEDALIQPACGILLEYEEGDVLPPIAGSRSLVIPKYGYRERFRLARRNDPAHLTFVAAGRVRAEVATVGSLEPAPFDGTPVVTPADCEKYAAFCAQVGEGELKHYRFDLPEGDGDVLVRLYNEDRTPWASAGGSDLCVDDLQLE
jgi:hypothetical protein